MDDRLLRRDDFYIAGRWSAPAGRERCQVVSPFTESPIGELPRATTTDIDRAVEAARVAFDEGPWPRMRATERAKRLAQAADALSQRATDIAHITVEEMGCAISHAPRAQTALVAAVFSYYADLLSSFPLQRAVRVGSRAGLVSQLPVGVVGAIVPWNAPVTLASWKTAPALAAGCTVVLKPALEAPLSNYVFAEALEQADIPPGVVNVVPGGREVGEHLVTHPGVDKIAFTGSTAVGQRIMALCAERVTRVSLELGGKSAALVLDDADLDAAVSAASRSAMHLSGQFCGAQTRILVPRAHYARAVEIAAAAVSDVPVGDPHDPATVVGPLVAERQRARVLSLIAHAAEQGARVVVGGGRPPHLPHGWFVAPTVLAEVDNAMQVAQEEIFGPVVCLLAHDGDDDAVRIANDSRYGLAGSVWSADDHRALEVAQRLRTGSVTVNGAPAPFPHVPFGGFKQSGLGRELGPEGLSAYLEARSVGLPPSLAAERVTRSSVPPC